MIWVGAHMCTTGFPSFFGQPLHPFKARADRHIDIENHACQHKRNTRRFDEVEEGSLAGYSSGATKFLHLWGYRQRCQQLARETAGLHLNPAEGKIFAKVRLETLHAARRRAHFDGNGPVIIRLTIF